MGWLAFALLVTFVMVLDLGVVNRRAHEVKMREALIWSSIWISLALLFNLGIYYFRGRGPAMEFLAGYLIEESLSVDNLFVFLLIFNYFKVPSIHQHKILFWGILGVLVFRALFILAGVGLIHRFHWVLYLFGAILIVSGIRLGIEKEKEIHPEQNPALLLFRRFFSITKGYEESRFFVRREGVLWATPLFVVLLVIETTDIVFAVDSIPAILAITTDPFIVYTSNVFAVLGLRSLYFALAGLMRLFHHLHYGLAAVLVFVGIKMIVSEFYRIPTAAALGVIALALVLSIAASLMWPPSTGGRPGS